MLNTGVEPKSYRCRSQPIHVVAPVRSCMYTLIDLCLILITFILNSIVLDNDVWVKHTLL